MVNPPLTETASGPDEHHSSSPQLTITPALTEASLLHPWLGPHVHVGRGTGLRPRKRYRLGEFLISRLRSISICIDLLIEGREHMGCPPGETRQAISHGAHHIERWRKAEEHFSRKREGGDGVSHMIACRKVQPPCKSTQICDLHFWQLPTIPSNRSHARLLAGCIDSQIEP
ncbi:hypothetical protein BHM03_00002995 [Ensete ventricosum]|nr:hypothetical protein BHM03_00002995 [Ensete ventricosum]